jgi:hypothetical protein
MDVPTAGGLVGVLSGDQSGTIWKPQAIRARRCRIPPFVNLQRRIINHRAPILPWIEHSLPNGRIESVNAKIRLAYVAFGLL